MLKPIAVLLVSLVLAACAVPRNEDAPVSARTELIYEPAASADRTVYFVPGALSSVEIFAGARKVFQGQTLAFYPLPGLDGRPLYPALDIEFAGQELAQAIIADGDESVWIVGYSMGAAIALEAAHRLPPELNIHLALVSPLPEQAGGLGTKVRGARDLATVALRARSTDIARVWHEYWKLLLVGRRDYLQGSRRDYAANMLQRFRDEIVLPTKQLQAAQTADSVTWRLPSPFEGRRYKIAVFSGSNDPVFSSRQTSKLSAKLGGGERSSYQGQGHLLPISEPRLYSDIAAFFDGP